MSTLVVLAAGLGSRYGSLKQIDSFGPSGETIMEYSVYDAIRAGFKYVVFIIRRDNEDEFKNVFAGKFKNNIKIDYAFQEPDVLPQGIRCPTDRIKPWGTGHALLSASQKVYGPFGVINADDFYGAESFNILYDRLASMDAGKLEACLVAYRLMYTLSDNGSVSRGICTLTKNDELLRLTERTHIFKRPGNHFYFTENGKKHLLTGNELVSMNLMGFTPPFFEVLKTGFTLFLKNNLQDLSAEYFLPDAVTEMLNLYSAKMSVTETPEKTYGVTYSKDKAFVKEELRKLIERGIYPDNLWN